QGPHLGRERPTTPGIEGVVADIVESFGDRQHVLQLEPSLHQTLLRVAQHSLGDQHLGHRRYCMPGFQTGFFARFSFRALISFSRATASLSARMPVARCAAFLAPASPMATVATGIPAGICAIERSASSPPRAPAESGTPITGSRLQAAPTPGSRPARPAPARR